MTAPPAKMISSSSRPATIHFFMLLTTGKSTFATLLGKRLFAIWRHTRTLDGGNIRQGLSGDLGFSEPDRVENIRRVMEVSKLFVDARLAVIVSFISPYRAEREILPPRFDSDEFWETFVDTPLQERECPVPKGLHAKERRGEWANFTDIDAKHEAPKAPDIRLGTVARKADECLDLILLALDPRSLHHATENWGAT
ncbi:MAG TPA: adenylyl-sulfate kinase [Terracidiphilus sp.]